MSFTRRIEDFTCEHCGYSVQGSGYTNHCPKCLYSKHVDNDPGDRAASCGGIMEPIRIEGSATEPRIVHKCLTCGLERVVTAASNDDPEAILGCAQSAAAR